MMSFFHRDKLSGTSGKKSSHERTNGKAVATSSRRMPTQDAASLPVKSRSRATSPDGTQDEERLGLLTMWPRPDDVANPISSTTIDIVAIHGLGGDVYKTWTDEHNGRLWLRDFLPYDASDAHIMSFGYNSAVAFSGSVSGIDDFSSSLLQSLITRRRKTGTQKHPLIFVCHSLGGIVFKKALILAHERLSQFQELLTAVKGVMFMGTPHRGSDVAYWGRVLGNLANVPLLRRIRTDLLKDLGPKSEVLGNICSQFVERAVPLKIITVYERVKVKGLTDLIVDKDSAVLNLPNESTMPIECDHIDMCKFRSDSSAVYEVISDCVSRLIEDAKDRAAQIYESPQRTIIDWLRKDSKASIVLASMTPPCEGTSTWILEDARFRGWLNINGCRLLWIQGSPGSGKTTLITIVLGLLLQRQADHSQRPQLRGTRPELVAYYFFTRRREIGRTFADAVKEIAAQLLDGDASLVVHIPKRYWYGRTIPTEHTAVHFLKTMLRNSNGPCIRIVVDALNESENDECAEQIASLFAQLLEEDYFSRLTIMVTDQRPPLANLEHMPRSLASVVEVKGVSVTGDVAAFVDDQLTKFGQRKRLPYDEIRNVKESIKSISQGNFLHAKLAIDSFIGDVNTWSRSIVKRQLETVKGVPPTLEAHYCHMLTLVKKDFVERARLLFGLIRFESAMLTLKEVQYAITISDEHDSYSEIEADIPFDIERNLPYLCGSIIEMKGGGIQFYHESALQLFEHQPLDPANARVLFPFQITRGDYNVLLARICLRVLNLRELRSPWISTTLDLVKELSLLSEKRDPKTVAMYGILDAEAVFPLLQYTIKSWHTYFTSSSIEESTVCSLIQWLSTAEARFILPPRIIDENPGTVKYDGKESYHSLLLGRSQDGIPTSPFELLIACGDMPSALKLSIATGTHSDWAAKSCSLLCWALRFARNNTVEYFLSLPVPFDCPRGNAGPLHFAVLAAARVHNAKSAYILGLLLKDPRFDVNASDQHGETPMHWLLRLHHDRGRKREIWDQFVAVPGLNINAESESGSPIFAATFCRQANQELTNELLARPDLNVDICKADRGGTNIILSADALGWYDIRSTLISRFPLFACNHVLASGHSIISEFAFMGRRDVVLEILGHIPLAERSHYREAGDWSLISLCAHQDWLDVVTLLINGFNAKFPAADHMGRTALHWAVENDWELVEAYEVLARDRRLDVQDRDGKTALHLAAETSNVAAGSWLLARGASYSLMDKYGMNPVHVSGERFCRGILKLLLEGNTREFHKDSHGRSILHYLAKWSDKDFTLKFCETKRLLVDLRDHGGRTPLHYAALCSNVDTTSALLKLEASVDAIDNIGHSPLHYAIRNGNLQVVEKLLKAGANHSILSRYLQTNLQLAAISGNQEIMLLFRKEPRRSKRVDNFQRSLLHDLARGHWDGDGWLRKTVEKSCCKVDHRDIHGRTPLHIAALKNNMELVRYLLDDSGADSSPVDAHGCSPLDWVTNAGLKPMIHLLERRGAVKTAGPHGKAFMASHWQKPALPADPSRDPKLQIVVWKDPGDEHETTKNNGTNLRQNQLPERKAAKD